ncbi:MAG: MbcA/ParS/Xre antitoxin family protein [Alphaproteobacteria bacterium]|nr:MbcA/ParS/Xre antitoxin family protein [Alphaproteobacteria bacterium]
MSERERLLALGSPARSTYHNWVSKARTGRGLSLPLDTLLRLSAMLGIHKDLRILFGDPQRGVQWLRSANQASLFGGQRPIDLIVSGSQMGIIDVRRFLDGWRGGISAGPVDDEIEDQAWNDGDILIVDG